MKTIKYKKVENLMRFNNIRQFSLRDLKDGMVYKNGQWCRFILPDDERNRVLRLFASAVVSRNVEVYADRMDLADNYGIFRRITICMGRNGFSASY